MHAYRVGFTAGASRASCSIAACVALVGSACAFALVRSRDFVASDGEAGRGRGASPQPPPAPAAVLRARAAASRARDADQRRPCRPS